MDILDGIYTRRSIRRYTDKPVTREHLYEIIKAGSWAPSGLNNQPWRFVVIQDEKVRERLSECTKYHKIIKKAPSCIAVYIDKNVMYNEVKDHQAMGACIQNMLLAAHALGLGAVWLGEILNSADKASKVLDVPNNLDLMAVVAIGHPAEEEKKGNRKEISHLIITEM